MALSQNPLYLCILAELNIMQCLLIKIFAINIKNKIIKLNLTVLS